MSCMGCANMDAGVPQLLLALTVKLDCSDDTVPTYQAMTRVADLEQHVSQPGINTMQDDSPLGFC